MAQKLHFDLVSPERRLASKDVHMVVVPGDEGRFGVLAGHAPVMSTLSMGVLEVYAEAGGMPERIFVSGGFAEVTAQGLSVLAEEAIAVSEINPETLSLEIGRAREDLASAKTTSEQTRLERQLERLELMRKASQN
jgi:F-type H+-transporting ATPase subunit epsilon